MQLINTAARDATAVVRRLRELYRERRESVIDDAAVDLAPLRRGGRRADPAALEEPGAQPGHHDRGETACRRRCRSSSATPRAIREMLTNLIFNAVDAMPKGGTIAVTRPGRGRRDAARGAATPAPA